MVIEVKERLILTQDKNRFTILHITDQGNEIPSINSLAGIVSTSEGTYIYTCVMTGKF